MQLAAAEERRNAKKLEQVTLEKKRRAIYGSPPGSPREQPLFKEKDSIWFQRW